MPEKSQGQAVSVHLMLGRSHKDFGFMVDFNKSRAIVRANTKMIDGVYLEDIPDGVSGHAPGMVLVHRDWKNVYFLLERSGWNDDDYFDLAEKRLLALGILHP